MLFQYLSGFEPILYTTHTNEEPIFFIIENSVIRFADTMMRIEAIIIVSAIGVAAIIGALYLLFAKYND